MDDGKSIYTEEHIYYPGYVDERLSGYIDTI